MKNSIPFQSSGHKSIRRSPAARTPQSADRPRALRLGRRLALPLVLLGAVLLARPCGAAPGQWDFTGSLHDARYDHTTTKLADGRVLVASGRSSGDIDLKSAELYDPATGNWAATGDLSTVRIEHAASLLADGRVLVEGGFNFDGTESEATAELYDPGSGLWTPTGSLHIGRDRHTSTLLPDGRVLVAGGFTPDGFDAGSSELYNPATGLWTTTGSVYRISHTATRLADGRVLIAGGYDPELNFYYNNAVIYDPATNTFTSGGTMHEFRASHTATLLPDGRVLVAGGYSPPNDLATSEIYDPATGAWTLTGNLTTPRSVAQAALLPNGQVLLAGGDWGISSAELYDPASGAWTATDSLNTARGNFSMTLLDTGKVLAAAGINDATALASAELYDSGAMTEATTVHGTGFVPGQGGVARFTLRATKSGNHPNGSLTFHDVGADIAFRNVKVRTLTFNGHSADLTGNARLGDGTKVTYSVTATDNSSSGSPDTFSITLSNGYSAGGAVTNGDILIQ